MDNFDYAKSRYIGGGQNPAPWSELRGQITAISFSDSISSIGRDAFYGCTQLRSIKIPSGITEIDSYTFEGCTSLTSVEIPSSVTRINSEAFYGCSSLATITIPASVRVIEYRAFSGTALTSASTHWKHDPLVDYTMLSDSLFGGPFDFEGWPTGA